MTDEEKVDELAKIGRKHKIRPGQRLTAGTVPLPEELQAFFDEVFPDLGDAKRRRLYRGRHTADALDRLGVASASGKRLQESHISNVRKKLRGSGPAYSKPGYKGKNHHAFGSGSAPDKTDFAQDV